jgi:hypothetical protein
MSKGRGIAPRKTSPKVSLRDQQSASDDIGAGSISDTRQPVTCWTFGLIDITPAAKRSKAGLRVIGSVQGKKVLVLADSALLGIAPPQESAEIISALSENGGKLSGQIESVSDDGLEVIVTICLY